MQALSMIDTMIRNEGPVPAKPAEPEGKSFGRVMDEQRQAATKAPADPRQPKAAERQTAPRTEGSGGAETPLKNERRPEDPGGGKSEVFADNTTEPKLQHTLMQLMKVIAAGETPEAVETFGSKEELLGRLAEQLEEAELNGGLNGEQVLAGIDLSTLSEQLQNLPAEEGQERSTRLAEQLGLRLEQQLSAEPVPGKVEENAAAVLAASENPETKGAFEGLKAARQVLQRAIDGAVTQPARVADDGTAAVTDEVRVQGPSGTDEALEEADPRFSGLLKPRPENPPVAQESRAGMNRPFDQSREPGSATAPLAEEPDGAGEGVELARWLGRNGQATENLNHQAPGLAQPVGQPGHSPSSAAAQVIQLASGRQVAESQIFDQVVTHISGSHNGESGRMVLRLQPAELGSLKLELMVEGDRIKANIHAQSMQVQEVIERNLPQLRSALAEQGLKIDQFQVNIDKGQQGGQFDNQAQQDHDRGFPQHRNWNRNPETEEPMIPLAHLIQNGGEGISLHV